MRAEIFATTKVSEGFRRARTHVARMVLFDWGPCNGRVRHARARAARVASWEINAEKTSGFYVSARAREQKFQTCADEKVLCFHMFY